MQMETMTLAAKVEFVTTPPRVFVVGSTMPNLAAFNDYLAYRDESWTSIDTDERNQHDPATVSEWAGRVCYMSFSNAKSRVRERYLQESILSHKHGSVIEHVSFNLLCADVPRDIQLEFVRHRAGTGYSWESTRFTDKHLRFVIPPRLRDNPDAEQIFREGILRQVEAYEALRRLIDTGLTVLLVEQDVSVALKIANRACILEGGRVVLQGSAAELRNSPRVREQYFGA